MILRIFGHYSSVDFTCTNMFEGIESISCRWHALGHLCVVCVPGVSLGPWNLETLALPEPGRVRRSGT